MRQPHIFIISEDFHVTDLGRYGISTFNHVNLRYLPPELKRACPDVDVNKSMVRVIRYEINESVDFISTTPFVDIFDMTGKHKEYEDIVILGTIDNHDFVVESSGNGVVKFNRHLYLIKPFGAEDKFILQKKQNAVLCNLIDLRFYSRYKGDPWSTINSKITDVMREWAGQEIAPELKIIPSLNTPSQRKNPIFERMKWVVL